MFKLMITIVDPNAQQKEQGDPNALLKILYPKPYVNCNLFAVVECN